MAEGDAEKKKGEGDEEEVVLDGEVAREGEEEGREREVHIDPALVGTASAARLRRAHDDVEDALTEVTGDRTDALRAEMEGGTEEEEKGPRDDVEDKINEKLEGKIETIDDLRTLSITELFALENKYEGILFYAFTDFKEGSDKVEFDRWHQWYRDPQDGERFTIQFQGNMAAEKKLGAADILPPSVRHITVIPNDENSPRVSDRRIGLKGREDNDGTGFFDKKGYMWVYSGYEVIIGKVNLDSLGGELEITEAGVDATFEEKYRKEAVEGDIDGLGELDYEAYERDHGAEDRKFKEKLPKRSRYNKRNGIDLTAEMAAELGLDYKARNASDITSVLDERPDFYHYCNSARERIASTKGVNIPVHVMLAEISVESGSFDVMAKADPTLSTATGLLQFTDSTWRGFLNGPDSQYIHDKMAKDSVWRHIDPMDWRYHPEAIIFATYVQIANKLKGLHRTHQSNPFRCEKFQNSHMAKWEGSPSPTNQVTFHEDDAWILHFLHHDGAGGARKRLRFMYAREQGEDPRAAATRLDLEGFQYRYHDKDNEACEGGVCGRGGAEDPTGDPVKSLEQILRHSEKGVKASQRYRAQLQGYSVGESTNWGWGEEIVLDENGQEVSIDGVDPEIVRMLLEDYPFNVHDVVPAVSGRVGIYQTDRFHPIDKVYRDHKGIDISAPLGSEIHAWRGGTVHIEKDKHPGEQRGNGNKVVIRHGGGVRSVYIHLDAFAAGLREGQRVETGQVIGTVGNTGLSTGPHLHMEIHHKGKSINPLAFNENAEKREVVREGRESAETLQASEVMLVGDSILWHSRGGITVNGEQIPTREDTDVLMWGEKANELLEGLRSKDNLADIEVAVIKCGGNNFSLEELEEGENYTAEQVFGYLEEMVEVLRAANPDVKIILSTFSPANSHEYTELAAKGPDGKIVQVNEMIRSLAASDPNIELFDLYEIFGDENGNLLPEYANDDNLHLSGSGDYREWKEGDGKKYLAELLTEKIDEVGGQIEEERRSLDYAEDIDSALRASEKHPYNLVLQDGVGVSGFIGFPGGNTKTFSSEYPANQFSSELAESQLRYLHSQGITNIVTLTSVRGARGKLNKVLAELRDEDIHFNHIEFDIANSMEEYLWGSKTEEFDELVDLVGSGDDFITMCRHGAHRAPAVTAAALLASGRHTSLGDAFGQANGKFSSYGTNGKKIFAELVKYAQSIEGVTIEDEFYYKLRSFPSQYTKGIEMP